LRSASVCLSVSLSGCPLAYLSNLVSKLHDILCGRRGSVLLSRQCSTLCTSGFLVTSCFQIIRRMWRTVRHGRDASHWAATLQRRRNFSASAPPLYALPPADWHPLTVSLAAHNGYLPRRRASTSIDRFEHALLAERGTRTRTTCADTISRSER